jgi:Glycosyltransferase family 87
MAVGLAERLAFFSPVGAAAIVLGVLVLALSAIAPDPPGSGHVGYPALLVALAALTALVPLVPGPLDPLVTGLTVGGAAAFYAFGVVPALRRYRLLVSAALLIAAHAVIIVRLPVPPHQDVWRFLNFGVDALLKGRDPYGNFVGADGAIIRLTYPPGVILLLAPFRAFAGDIRWGYVLCEALVVLLLPRLLRRRGAAVARWQEAVILLPLVLPRASQAFFVFSNQEWLLLALAAAGLLLWTEQRWLLAGLVIGLGIASKQYFVVFPVLFLLPLLGRRVALTGLAVAALVTLPFVAWDPGAFGGHVFGLLAAAPDPDRVTAWAILVHLGLPQSRLVAAGLAVAGGGAALGLAWAGRRSLTSALLACGLGLFAFTLGATFAGYNYYVYGLLFFTWGLMLPARPVAVASGPPDKIRYI